MLAVDLSRTTGKIGLRRTAGGFGQPEHLTADGTRRRLRVDGDQLVVLDGDLEQWSEIATVASAAARVGVDLPTNPSEDDESTLALDPTQPWAPDADATRLLAEFFELAEAALETVRRAHASSTPSIVQLWPEHFDLACSVNEVNLGGSPGDDDHPEPYWYVGPWAPVSGSFFNEPWGASRPVDAFTDAAAIAEFFDDGLRQAIASRR